MYNYICSIFLNNLRALRYYVSSVSPTMDNVMDEKQINNNDSLFAGTIYTMEKIKERGSSLSDRSQEVENMPQEVIDYLKAIENLIQEMEDDGEKLPDCLPRNIKREYQKFEAKERQKEIVRPDEGRVVWQVRSLSAKV
ncbi:hypothetical protein D7V83_15565 [bacterium 0.1xD8-71]|nr:hypothetical protein D7V83_15565 [bacterium 0.1xD8-71]